MKKTYYYGVRITCAILFFERDRNVKIKQLVKTALSMLLLLVLISTNLDAADVWRNPAGYPEGLDTWFGSYYNTSAQHDYRLRVGGWGDYYYTLLRFDLSGLPLSASQVLIWRYTINDGGTPTAINWWKIGQQWQSSSVTYSSFPWGTLVPYGQTGAPSPGYWYTVDITSFYNNWRAGSVGNQNYGFLLSPANNNNNYSSFYSSTQGGGYGPWLQVTYTPQGTDSIIKLKWPLASPVYASRVVTQAFNVDWAGGSYCGGLIKKHNGTDFQASAGTAVYAGEDGFVKEITYDAGWEYNIVLEHNHPAGGKFTTVYWHVSPSVSVGNFVPKGMQMATVANLGGSTHFHLGVRNGTYTAGVSGTGALPQTDCGGFPAMPASFIDPNNTSNVIFN